MNLFDQIVLRPPGATTQRDEGDWKRRRAAEIDLEIAEAMRSLADLRKTIDTASIEYTVSNSGAMETVWLLEFEKCRLQNRHSDALEASKEAERWAQRKTQAVCKRREDLLPKLIAMLKEQEDARKRLASL